MVRFAKLKGPIFLFQAGASGSCSIHVPTHFGDSARESTISHPSRKNKGGSDVNKSNLNKDNTIKPTFDTLTEEDRMVLEA
jgi:hypothetical protein